MMVVSHCLCCIAGARAPARGRRGDGGAQALHAPDRRRYVYRAPPVFLFSPFPLLPLRVCLFCRCEYAQCIWLHTYSTGIWEGAREGERFVHTNHQPALQLQPSLHCPNASELVAGGIVSYRRGPPECRSSTRNNLADRSEGRTDGRRTWLCPRQVHAHSCWSVLRRTGQVRRSDPARGWS